MNNITNLSSIMDPCARAPDALGSAVALAASAALLLALGFNWQRRGFRSKSIPRYTWVVGTLAVMSGASLYYGAYAFAPEAFVAPLLVLCIPTSMVLGKLINGERVGNEAGMHGFMVTLGSMLMAVSASACAKNEPVETAKMVPYVVVVSVTILLCVGVMLWAKKLRGDAEHAPGKDYLKVVPLIRFVLPFSAGLMVAASSVAIRAIALFPNLWALVFLVGCFSLPAMYLVNVALLMFETRSTIPVLMATIIFFAVLGGGLVFNEFDYESGHMTFVGIVGIVITVAGCVMLVRDDEYSLIKEPPHRTDGASGASDLRFGVDEEQELQDRMPGA